MGTQEEFTASQDRFWRALVRVATLLPRSLDDDLRRDTPISLTEFAALLHLSEAPEGTARMSDLAAMTGLSPSRISRVCLEMETRGLLEKQKSVEDARSNLVTITSAGRAQYRAAYPVQVAGAHRLLFSETSDGDVRAATSVLERIVGRLQADTL